MIGDCIQEEYAPIVNLLHVPGFQYDVTLFINPKLPLINSIFACCAARHSSIVTGFSTPMVLADANHQADLYNGVTGVVGGQTMHPFTSGTPLVPAIYTPVFSPYSGYSGMGQYQAMTGFMAGTSASFPSSNIDPSLLAGISGSGFLNSLSFPGMLALVGGAKAIEAILCLTPGGDPCKIVTDVLGTLLGADDPFLESICGIVGATDLVSDLVGILNQIIAIITSALTALVNNLMRGFSYSLAKLLKNTDPCLQNIVNVIAGPDLQIALGIG